MSGNCGSVGAFYHPHLAREASLCSLGSSSTSQWRIRPVPMTSFSPPLRARFTLLLHDFLGQLSEPLAPAALE